MSSGAYPDLLRPVLDDYFAEAEEHLAILEALDDLATMLRAGINVVRIRATVFVISSALAAIGRFLGDPVPALLGGA